MEVACVNQGVESDEEADSFSKGIQKLRPSADCVEEFDPISIVTQEMKHSSDEPITIS